MKKFIGLAMLFAVLVSACDHESVAPDLDLVGTWEGTSLCDPGNDTDMASFVVTKGTDSCEECYSFAFLIDDNQLGVLTADYSSGQLFFESTIFNEGSDVDEVRLKSGKGSLESNGQLRLGFDLVELSNDNYEYSCSFTLDKK